MFLTGVKMTHVERTSILETRMDALENEVETLREFKHSTNGTLQQHEGVFNLLRASLVNIEKAITDSADKLSKLNDMKFIIIGGCAFASVLFTALVVGIKFYMDYLK